MNKYSRLWVLYLIVAVFAFIYAYFSIVVPNFSYEGYGTDGIESRLINILVLIVVSIIAILLFEPFHLFYFLFIILPSVVLYYLTDSVKYNYILGLYIIQFGWILSGVISMLDVDLVEKKNYSKLDLNLTHIILAISFILMLYNFGFGGLEDIFSYDLRAAHYEYLNPQVARIVNISANFMPIVLLVSFANNRFRLSLFLFVLSSLIFAMSMSKKEPLLFIPFVGLYYIYFHLRSGCEDWILKTKEIIGLSFLMVVAVSSVSYILYDDLWISSTLIRRFLLLPILIGSEWFNYAGEHGFSIFNDAEFYEVHKYHIGDIMGKFGAGANVGVIGTAYDYAGWVGLFSSGFVVSIYFKFIYKFLSGFGLGNDLNYFLALLVVHQILISSSFTTFLFTHGGFFPLLVLFIARLLKKSTLKLG
jgi:hypothetical protein